MVHGIHLIAPTLLMELTDNDFFYKIFLVLEVSSLNECPKNHVQHRKGKITQIHHQNATPLYIGDKRSLAPNCIQQHVIVLNYR